MIYCSLISCQVIYTCGVAQKNVLSSISNLGVSVWILHVLPVSNCVASGYLRFLPQSKDQVIGETEIVLSVCVCFSSLQHIAVLLRRLVYLSFVLLSVSR